MCESEDDSIGTNESEDDSISTNESEDDSIGTNESEDDSIGTNESEDDSIGTNAPKISRLCLNRLYTVYIVDFDQLRSRSLGLWHLEIVRQIYNVL